MSDHQPISKGLAHTTTERLLREETLEERALRLLARAPVWIASAIVHVALIGILLQISALNRLEKEPKTFSVTLADRKNESELDRGEDTLDSPIPVVDPIVDPASFKWDEDQTAADEALEEFAADDSIRLVSIYGDYGVRTKGGRSEAVRRGGGTAGSERAVELALEWLGRHQDAAGGWGAHGYIKKCMPADKCNRLREPLRSIDPGLTGLATLAFLGAGYTDQAGRFRQNVDRALDHILKIQTQSGHFGAIAGGQSIYNHAICTLAVSEAYGMTKNDRYKAAAEKGIAYVLKGQHTDGGWGYFRNGAANYKSDVSVTGWIIMALKSAEMAGMKVPRAAWRRALEFVDAASDAKGLAGYTGPDKFVTRVNRSTVGVGLLCRQFSPVKVGAAKQSDIADALAGMLPSEKEEGFFYHAYYGGLSLYQRGGPQWHKWNNHVRDLLVKTQKNEGCETGSWSPGDKRWASWAGRVYSTAMAALTLEVYYRYLPIHRGHADDSPEAARLAAYQKALKAYRLCIGLSDIKTTPPEKLAAARDRAAKALEAYRQCAGTKAENEGAEERRRRRLAATTIRLATIHLRGGKYAKCIEEVKNFTARFPEHKDQETPRKLYAGCLALLARQFDQEGEASRAEVIRRELVEDGYRRIIRDPDQPFAVYIRVARDFYSREDFVRGADMFSEIIERFAGEPAVRENLPAIRLRLANCLLKSQRAEQALKIFEVLYGRAKSIPVLYGLAECYLQTGRYEDALKIYAELRRGCKTDGENWWRAKYNIANTLMLLGKTDKCRRSILLQRELRPKLGGPEMRAKFERLLRDCERIDGATSGS